MKELPEKIILDYSCEKTATQNLICKLLDLHFPFVRDTKSNQSREKDTNQLVSVHYHKNICNDPKMLLEDEKFMNKLWTLVNEKEFFADLKKANEEDGHSES